MKKNGAIILILALIFSCQTKPDLQGWPDWLNQLPVLEGYSYFASYQPYDSLSAENDLKEDLTFQIMDSLGFNSEMGDAAGKAEFDKLKDEISRSLNDFELAAPEIVLVEKGIYAGPDAAVLAALVKVDNSLLTRMQNSLIPFFLDEIPEIDALINKALEALDAGFPGSAFLLYSQAAGIAAQLDSASAKYLMQQNINAAAEILKSLDFNTQGVPGFLYSGEKGTDPFQISVSLDERQGDRLWYLVLYPHGMDPDKMALARVQSSFDGTMKFEQPPVYRVGDYEIQVSLDPQDIARRMGIADTADYPGLQQALQSKSWTYPFRVELDMKRLQMGLLITDRDVLGNPVEGGTTAQKSSELLRDAGYDIRRIKGPVLSLDDAETPGILREITQSLDPPVDLLLLGESTIIDYQASGGRVEITGQFLYRLWDLRTYRVLRQGLVVKQWESTQTDQALNNLHTQLSRALIEEFP